MNLAQGDQAMLILVGILCATYILKRAIEEYALYRWKKVESIANEVRQQYLGDAKGHIKIDYENPEGTVVELSEFYDWLDDEKGAVRTGFEAVNLAQEYVDARNGTDIFGEKL